MESEEKRGEKKMGKKEKETGNDYVQYLPPDKEKLSNLLALCKGSKRTMASFAETIGINAVVLSKILNGRISRPLRVEDIKVIVANKDPEANVTIGQFLNANGMYTQEEINRQSRLVREKATHIQYRRFAEAAEFAIDRALKSRQISSVKIIDRYSADIRAHDFLYSADAKYHTSDTKQSKWIFDFRFFLDDNAYINRVLEPTQNRINKYLLAGVLYPDDLKDTRLFVVINNQSAYEEICNFLDPLPISNVALSILLTDQDGKKLVNEKDYFGDDVVDGILCRPELFDGEDDLSDLFESDFD